VNESQLPPTLTFLDLLDNDGIRKVQSVVTQKVDGTRKCVIA
jgi:hypothetical protein